LRRIQKEGKVAPVDVRRSAYVAEVSGCVVHVGPFGICSQDAPEENLAVTLFANVNCSPLGWHRSSPLELVDTKRR